MREPDVNIERSLRLARDLIDLSRDGLDACEDEGCVALYGTVSDCAYRILGQADRERRAHDMRRGAGIPGDNRAFG